MTNPEVDGRRSVLEVQLEDFSVRFRVLYRRFSSPWLGRGMCRLTFAEQLDLFLWFFRVQLSPSEWPSSRRPNLRYRCQSAVRGASMRRRGLRERFGFKQRQLKLCRLARSSRRTV